jgi:hypothetical protein
MKRLNKKTIIAVGVISFLFGFTISIPTFAVISPNSGICNDNTQNYSNRLVVFTSIIN